MQDNRSDPHQENALSVKVCSGTVTERFGRSSVVIVAIQAINDFFVTGLNLQPSRAADGFSLVMGNLLLLMLLISFV